MNLPEDPLARWSALLKCGHEARTRGKPEPSQSIACITSPCQGQQRVVSVSAVRQVPEPGEIGIQGALWEAAA